MNIKILFKNRFFHDEAEKNYLQWSYHAIDIFGHCIELDVIGSVSGTQIFTQKLGVEPTCLSACISQSAGFSHIPLITTSFPQRTNEALLTHCNSTGTLGHGDIRLILTFRASVPSISSVSPSRPVRTSSLYVLEQLALEPAVLRYIASHHHTITAGTCDVYKRNRMIRS